MFSCHTGCQEFSTCCTSGESEESIAYRRQSRQVRDPPWLRNPGQMSSEVESGYRWPHKKDLCVPKIKTKKSKNKNKNTKFILLRVQSSNQWYSNSKDYCNVWIMSWWPTLEMHKISHIVHCLLNFQSKVSRAQANFEVVNCTNLFPWTSWDRQYFQLHMSLCDYSYSKVVVLNSRFHMIGIRSRLY